MSDTKPGEGPNLGPLCGHFSAQDDFPRRVALISGGVGLSLVAMSGWWSSPLLNGLGIGAILGAGLGFCTRPRIPIRRVQMFAKGFLYEIIGDVVCVRWEDITRVVVLYQTKVIRIHTRDDRTHHLSHWYFRWPDLLKLIDTMRSRTTWLSEPPEWGELH